MEHHEDVIYANFVSALFKTMGTKEASLMHAAVGISGEAGEIIDAVKKASLTLAPGV